MIKTSDFLLYEFEISLDLIETLKIVIDITKKIKHENVTIK